MAKVMKVKTLKELGILNFLLQEYEHEFSTITGKIPNKSGHYQLDVDLSKTDNFLLLEDEQPKGFCVKGFNNGRHDIHEFYVVPDFRGQGVGEVFAHQIFNKYPGSWQVRQIAGADKAKKFWVKSIDSFSSGQFKNETINDRYWGRVSIQTFEVCR